MAMSVALEGKRTIVTGAGAGLGRAYALAIAAAGGVVVVNDIDGGAAAGVVEEIRAAGGTAVAAVGSIADADFAEALIDVSREEFGGLDGFVANAAIFRPGSPFEEDEASLRQFVEVNVLGAMLTGTAALRAMRDAGGSLALITSGARCGQPGATTYGATKGAVASLAWGWAIEAAPYRIRVNAVSPVALTAMFDQLPSGAVTPPPPESIAPLIVYLMSDASAAVTGQVIRFTGDKLSLYPTPSTTSVEVAVERPDPDRIAAVFKAELGGRLAAVGSAGDLTPGIA